MYQTLNNVNNEDAFGAKEGSVQRAQPGIGANWGKAPVSPSDPAYMTLAKLSNQDTFGALERGGDGGGHKAPVNPSDPAYITLAKLNTIEMPSEPWSGEDGVADIKLRSIPIQDWAEDRFRTRLPLQLTAPYT